MRHLFFIILFMNLISVEVNSQHKQNGIIIFNYFPIGDGNHYFIPINTYDSTKTFEQLIVANNLDTGFHIKNQYADLQLVYQKGKKFKHKIFPWEGENSIYINIAVVEIKFHENSFFSSKESDISKLPLHLFKEELWFYYDAAKYYLISDLRVLKVTD